MQSQKHHKLGLVHFALSAQIDFIAENRKVTGKLIEGFHAAIPRPRRWR